MRIDARSFDPSLPTTALLRSEMKGEQPGFQTLLQQALTFSQPPLKTSVPLAVPMPSSPFNPEDLATDHEKQKAEELEEVLNLRQEAYEEDLLENQEAMEDVIENWRETAEEHYEVLAESQSQEIEQEIEEVAEINDGSDNFEIANDIPEMALDVDNASIKGDRESGSAQGENQEGSNKRQSSYGNSGSTEISQIEEQEMSYEEIQHLVETVVNGSHTLPYKLHHLLRKFLDSLMSGHRYSLNQHNLMDLEFSDWKTLFKLFPPHFFAGLIRPMLYAAGKDTQQIQNHYELLEHILYQRGLSQTQLDQLELLWGQLVNLPAMFSAWLRQPELPTLALEDLQHPLEMLHQRQGDLPGATGRIQSLALQYLHHPETAIQLLEISRNTLHCLPLSDEQLSILSQKLTDYCFSQQLHNQSQIRSILKRALHGEELEQEEILLILQGAPQKILSHLPYYILPLSLQEIIQFIHTDPDHSEDNILALFLEN